MTNPTPSVMDEILPIISQAVADWRIKNSENTIRTRVTKLLDTSSEEITLKLLGFDKSRWDGKWSLDHCNGRSGESAASDFIRNVQADVIKEWLSTIPLPTLGLKLKQQMTAEAKQYYQEALENSLHRMITAQADKDAAELFKAISTSHQLDSHLKITQLLSQERQINASSS